MEQKIDPKLSCILTESVTVSIQAFSSSPSHLSLWRVTPHLSHTIESCQIISEQLSHVRGREWFTILNWWPERLGPGTYVSVLVCEGCVYIAMCRWISYCIKHQQFMSVHTYKHTYIYTQRGANIIVVAML